MRVVIAVEDDDGSVMESWVVDNSDDYTELVLLAESIVDEIQESTGNRPARLDP